METKRNYLKYQRVTKYTWPVAIFVLLSILYFMVPMIIMPDSTEYYEYLNIFYGVSPLSTWNVVRGFTMPVILFAITKVFGNTATGLLNGSYLFYASLLISSYLVYINIKKKISSKYKRIFLGIVYYVLIVFNPILYGYFHGLLTEFIAIPMALLACLLAYKYLNYKINIKSYKTYVYLVGYIFLFIFCWFLKQPYFTIALFPLCITIFLSIFKYKSIKDFLARFCTLAVCCALLIMSMGIWKNTLISAGVDYESGRNNEYFLSTAIVEGVSRFREAKPEESLNYEFLSRSEIEKIASHDYNYKIMNAFDSRGKLVDQIPLFFKGDIFSSKDAFAFLGKVYITHPFLCLESYVDGYLASINVFLSDRTPAGDYYPINKFVKEFNHENSSIGLSYLDIDNNFLWLMPYHQYKVENLNAEVNISSFIRAAVKAYANIHLWSFKLLFLILPVVLTIIFVMYLFKKNHSSRNELAIVFLGFAFLHTLFHVVTGAIIDRYIFVTFAEVVMGYSVLLITHKNSTSVLKREEVLVDKKNIMKKKVIFVIPAYNEAKHIAGVIADIRKNMKGADIVITNDYSTDNTQEIVESLHVPCLKHPFNMGYAMAVKTGIKYAHELGYDYVIQFDADGQHLASEAKKLVETMESTGSNIVIGSRFLSKTDYKHPFFRKIGTKLFEIIIKMFCKRDITDPTSGFQILDKSVIARYAKIGKYPEFPDANLIIEMLLEGYTISEVSVKMKLNDEGKSMHGGIIKPIKYMINVMYSILFILLRGKRGVKR